MSGQRLLPATLLSLVLFSTAGCAAIQGERVETGMSVAAQVDLEPDELSVDATPTTGQASAAGDAGQIETIGADDSHASVDHGLGVRPSSDLSPDWTTRPGAFDFVAPELFSGAPVLGADIHESGRVLVIFVSPSCVISAQDGPAYATTAEANPEVTFLFVHTKGDRESFVQFVDDADLYQQNAIHIDDSDLTLWNRFGVTSQPSTILVDHLGRASLTEGGLGHEGLTVAVSLLGNAG